MRQLGNINKLSRIFKFCNNQSNSLTETFKCIFNNNVNDNLNNNFNNNFNDNLEPHFKTYHYLNGEENIYNIKKDDNIDHDVNIEQDNNTLLKTKQPPFTPNDIRKAYSITNITPLPNIRRPIITIITCTRNPFLINDVNIFCKLFNLPKCDLKIYNFSNTFNPNWAAEMTIDVQWAYAMNTNAQIRVVSAKSPSITDVFQAISFANNKNNFNPKIDTDVLSMSFGMHDDGRFNAYNKYFSNTNTIYLASSGDNSIVSFPSCCIHNLAIGGTSLHLNTDKNRLSEIVWSSSGCGYSKSFSKPSYQPASTNRRITPDISCVADPNTPCYSVLGGKIYSIGGTSVSAPICSGILSQLQQQQLNNRKQTYTSVLNKTNSIQPLLYRHNDCFYDITQGKSGSYSATKGFDVASGLGVIKLSKTIDTLL